MLYIPSDAQRKNDLFGVTSFVVLWYAQIGRDPFQAFQRDVFFVGYGESHQQHPGGEVAGGGSYEVGGPNQYARVRSSTSTKAVLQYFITCITLSCVALTSPTFTRRACIFLRYSQNFHLLFMLLKPSVQLVVNAWRLTARGQLQL